MKDYSLNEEERKSFVLNYTKDEDTLTVNYADGSSFTIPNTDNNENKLEGKMVDQVTNSKRKKSELESSIVITIFLIFCLTTLSVNGASWLLNMSSIKEMAIGLGIAVVVDIPMLAKIIKNSSILKDIKKNSYFVENQEVINRGLNNANVLVNSNVQEKEIITINDIDNSYKYDELKHIVANTERQESFCFDTFPEGERPKIRRRKR